MQTARILKAVDSRTGNITLHGAARDRVAQAAAAGLIAEDMRADVEAVRRENERLRREMALDRALAEDRKRALNKYRREHLAGLLESSERDMRRIRRRESGASDIAFGFCVLGIALGSAIMAIMAAVIL